MAKSSGVALHTFVCSSALKAPDYGYPFTNTAAPYTSTPGNTPDSRATLGATYLNNFFTTAMEPSTDPGTNRVLTTNAGGTTATLTYDAAGNITYDGSNYQLALAWRNACVVAVMASYPLDLIDMDCLVLLSGSGLCGGTNRMAMIDAVRRKFFI